MMPATEPSADQEARFVARARAGDEAAFASLVEPWRRPLFAYIYRMVTRREDAEDLLQDVLVRVLEGLPRFRGEARFKSWVFGIATDVCLDHLRKKSRWRVEAQLEAERRALADPERYEQVHALLGRPGSVFEIREHIAFCFSCLARTLEPEAQAALLLREVLGFTAREAAAMIGISEPVFRHRLAAARRTMAEAYEGLCRLITKTGPCWQCRGLREVAPKTHRGADLVQIEVKPGVAVSAESLLDARLAIVRTADLEDGRSRALHDDFYAEIGRHEEAQ